ncbi:MAG: enoyl-CoA hydratase/isomerase family protein [Mycobacterium sp.]
MRVQQLSQRLNIRHDGKITYITVGAGERRNALTSQDWTALRQAFLTMATDTQLGVVVLRGAGATFSSGSDIGEWAAASAPAVDRSFNYMEEAFQSIESLPVPVIAIVEGVAVGAGCQLALACDLQLLARSARIGMPIAQLGILISPAFAARLVTLTGPAIARDLLYTGRLLTATEAAHVGLVTRTVDDGALQAEVERLVTSIIDQPTASVRAAKSAVAALLAPVRETAEQSRGPDAVAYADFTNGVRNFLKSHIK